MAAEKRVISQIIAKKMDELIEKHDTKISWEKKKLEPLVIALTNEVEELFIELSAVDKLSIRRINEECMDVILTCAILMDKLNGWTTDRGRKVRIPDL